MSPYVVIYAYVSKRSYIRMQMLVHTYLKTYTYRLQISNIHICKIINTELESNETKRIGKLNSTD